MKLGYQLREGRDQLPTRPTTALEIMCRPAFAFGVEDARAGRGYRPEYDVWKDTNDRWSYERGRQWARIAPRSVHLKSGGTISAQALAWYKDDIL
jgi:hypothetical protein